MRRIVFLFLLLFAGSSHAAYYYLSGYQCGTGNPVATTKAQACAGTGYTTIINQGDPCPATGSTCSSSYGCGRSAAGYCKTITKPNITCNNTIPTVGTNGVYSCQSSCSGTLGAPIPTGMAVSPEGTQICAATTTCTAPNVITYSAPAYTCALPPCVAGQTFVGVGADTQPKCKGGCSYAISAPAVYGEVTPGLAGVHSRWTTSGAQCAAADELVAADVSGCPSEVSPDMASAICGIPPPCEDGKFLFSGECVADSAESGCVIVDGEQVCAEAEQNCVVINGKRICAEVPVDAADLETYKDNGCVWSFAQGAWVCPTDTATKMTSGTTTTETDPVTGNKTTTTVTTIRNNVTGGTTTTTTTVVTDPDGNEISRDVSEQTTGSGGEGGALIPAALGEKRMPEAPEWLREEQDVKDDLAARFAAVPIIAGVDGFLNVEFSGGAGTCPVLEIPLFGSSVSTTAHCEIMEEIGDVLGLVLMALYVLLGVRIVLSA